MGDQCSWISWVTLSHEFTYPWIFNKISNSLALKCNKSSYVTLRITSPRTSKIWIIHEHWPTRIRMIIQCCFISFKSMNFRNVLRKQCSATKTYPLQQTRCSSGHEMLMVLVLYVVLYSGEALLHKEQMNHLSLEMYLLCNKKWNFHQIGIISYIAFY